MPSINGETYYTVWNYAWSESFISGKVSQEKADRILALYDYLLSDEGYRPSHFGVEGVTYRLEEDGGITLLTGETPSGRYPSIGMLASLVAWNDGIQEDVGDSPSVPAEYQREDEKRVERARGCPIPDVFFS